jgi:protein phosphatase
VVLAREHHVLPVAIVFDLPEREVQARNRSRPDRQTPSHAIHRQISQLRQGIRGRQGLEREGFRHVWFFRSEEEVQDARVVRQRLWTDRRDDHGPFDIVGDVHGCFDELRALLDRLGYEVDSAPGPDGEHYAVRHPAGRRLIFLGDLVDRGPRIPDTLRLVMDAVRDGVALCVPGNHDAKLVRALRGRNVQIRHGLEESMRQLGLELPEFRDRVATFLDRLVSHYVLDSGNLVVAHAGMRQEFQGRSSATVRDFALFGETTGEIDDAGLPVRVEWARAYRGSAAVIYGHTPVSTPEWLNNTINIDTGCVFGGRLTALRWPERELVSVPAERVYAALPG